MAKKVEFNMATVKKYVFWVCAPLGLVVAVLMGMMAVGAVGNKLEDRKKQLNSQKETMTRLQGEAATHPNQGTVDEINEKRDELVEKIYSAWGTLVEEQQKRNLWTGLASVATRDIERKNFLDPLEPTTLTNYLNSAQNEIKKLLDNPDIDIRRVRSYRRFPDGREEPLETKEPLLTSEGGGGGFGRGGGSRGGAAFSSDSSSSRGGGGGGLFGGGGVTVIKGKVVWSSPQVDITMKNWGSQPLSFEVWLTQEDLWVHQALLWVVAKSNENSREASKVMSAGTTGLGSTAGASRPLDLSDSVIKEIVELSIGRKAAAELAKQSSRRVGSGFGGFGGFGGDSSDSGYGGMDKVIPP
jgi:uncharacterized membrane-anchored protein YhcB (DUF1043 family)